MPIGGEGGTNRLAGFDVPVDLAVSPGAGAAPVPAAQAVSSDAASASTAARPGRRDEHSWAIGFTSAMLIHVHRHGTSDFLMNSS